MGIDKQTSRRPYGPLASADTGNIRAFSVIAQSFTCNAASAVTVATTATKAVSGTFNPGGTVTYSVVLTNTGPGVQADNSGDEYVDVLPSQLTLVSATATRGTASMSGNTARWNGALEAGAAVTLTITATINAGTVGQTVSSQGTMNYDADHNGSNEATRLTDDTAVAGAANPTTFVVNSGAPQTVSVGFAGTGTGGTTSATSGLTCSANCSTSVAGAAHGRISVHGLAGRLLRHGGMYVQRERAKKSDGDLRAKWHGGDARHRCQRVRDQI